MVIRQRHRHALVAVIWALFLHGCSKNQRGGHARGDAGAVAALPHVVDAARPDAGPRSDRGDSCSDDNGCQWDDPCRATRCKAAGGPPHGGCDKSLPLPGECRCVDHQCTLKPGPDLAAKPGPACNRATDCQPDVGAGTCIIGTGSPGPITREGPVCECNNGACKLTWSGPFKCESFKDCSMKREPRLRPVPSSDVPRRVPHPIRPCREGEIDSVCTDDKVCEIVVWSC